MFVGKKMDDARVSSLILKKKLLKLKNTENAADDPGFGSF